MNGRKLSFFAATIAITCCSAALSGTAASGAVSTVVDPEMGAPVTDAYDCPGDALADYDFGSDPYGMYAIAQETGATSYYKQGLFGQGIDVALIDSGTADLAGLNNGNVVRGPDLSFESQAAYAADPDHRNPDLAFADTYGHGTHMAGIIAGRDKALPTKVKDFDWQDPTAFRGMAPASRVVSVKVADSMGAVDVTQVVAAIDWVVQNRNANGMNIRVLNLSLGIETAEPYQRDILAHAAQVAWDAGIVVVAAAGNGGRYVTKSNGMLPSPASNANIIAVGSYNTQGTIGEGKHADDTSSEFTQRGANKRAVDITAPGEHLMGLHVVGSHTDDEIWHDCQTTVQSTGSWTSPIAGVNGRFVRGSGTSQSAAIVSGAIALMLSKKNMTPNEVRVALMTNARALCKGHERTADGRGELNLSDDNACLRSGESKSPRPPKTVKLNQRDKAAGGGRIQAGRGEFPLPCSTAKSVKDNRRGERVLNGDYTVRYEHGLCQDMYESASLAALNKRLESDIHGHLLITSPNEPKGLPQTENRQQAWTVDADGGWHWMGGPAWFGSPLTINGKLQWPTTQWNTDWTGARWSTGDWAGARWSGARWSGARWSDGSWSGARWSGARWSGARWSDAVWRDLAWR